MDSKSISNEGAKGSVYDLPEDLNELTRRYKPKYLARGGGSLVYEIPDHPEVVVKVSAAEMKNIVLDNIAAGESLDSLREPYQQDLQGYLDHKTRRLARIRDYFGIEHALPERHYLAKVPVTPALLNEIFHNKPPAGLLLLKELWSVVIVQRRSEAAQDSEHLNLSGGYVERRVLCEGAKPESLDTPEYQELSERLLQFKRTDDPINIEKFLSVQNSVDLRALVAKAQEDRALSEMLKTLVATMIRFSRETGEILDTGGNENILIFEKDAAWNYHLIDALSIHDKPIVNITKETIAEIVRDDRISSEKADRKRLWLMKVLNYARTVNGLAEILGIPDRLHVIYDQDLDKTINFSKLFA